MRSIETLDDTIAAISTASGPAGIGIVRMSGPQAVTIAKKIFRSKKNSDVMSFRNHTAHYGWVISSDDDVIDEVLLVVMRAPHSYTKEDVVEISCHGGTVSLRAILSRLVDLGARMAEPGEFTKRAFLNGRIDLAQAEAVLDIIQSKTDAFLKVSTRQLKGELSTELESIRQRLMELYTELEAVLNFPEDDINAGERQKISASIGAEAARIDALLKTSDQGRVLRDGIKIVLCGKPNVGKSSLLNTLLRQPRAIVSPIEGTTRDTIEETANIRGIPFQLIDTAGILEPRDTIEEEAIKRSRMYIDSADLVILMIDGSSVLSPADISLMETVAGQNALVVLNKCDLTLQADEALIRAKFSPERIKKISALTKDGINSLEDMIVQIAWQGHSADTHGVLVTNLRHITSLKECVSALNKSSTLMTTRAPALEMISEEIRIGINCLDRITGRDIDGDLLDSIFDRFCIGK